MSKNRIANKELCLPVDLSVLKQINRRIRVPVGVPVTGIQFPLVLELIRPYRDQFGLGVGRTADRLILNRLIDGQSV
jgi:hypothetical protein